MKNGRSVRKPLRDVSNGNNHVGEGGLGRGSGGICCKKEGIGFEKREVRVSEKEQGGGGDKGKGNECLDRLLLVRSNLSSLTQQIDELVAQAFKVNAPIKQGNEELQQLLSQVLSDMLSSLTPWGPRLQKILSSSLMEGNDQLGNSLADKTASVNEDENLEIESPEQTKMESLISPSPLVSWRAGCNVERSRQLFMLTPLPMPKALSSRHQDLPTTAVDGKDSNPAVEIPSFFTMSRDGCDVLLEGITVKPTPKNPSDLGLSVAIGTHECGIASSPMVPEREQSFLVMTPYLKMSPPRSCMLLQPIAESSHRCNNKYRKSTPFPTGFHPQISESSSSEGSDDLALKYPELLGIQQAHRSRMTQKELDSSPDWSFSPPKTCVLLEPPDGKLESIAPVDAPVLNQQRISSLPKDVDGQVSLIKKSLSEETLGNSLPLVESTPMWKEPDSTMRTGKRPGENTLKKELWTKFEAASSFGARLNVFGIQRTAQKGFLDLLEEASCDGKSSVANGSR